MTKTIAALLAVAAIAGTLGTTPAKAHDGVGAGIAAGLIGGAIVGGAIASSNPYYYGGPGYYGPGYPAYAGAYGPCGWQRQRFWDGYAWRVRSVRVCY